MTIREAIDALLKENQELRMQLAARGYLHTDHSGREAGFAALREIDEADRRIAEAMIRRMEPMPYQLDGAHEPTDLPYAQRLNPDSDPQQLWIVETADGEDELTGPVDEATAKTVVGALRRSFDRRFRKTLQAHDALLRKLGVEPEEAKATPSPQRIEPFQYDPYDDPERE